MKTNIIFAFRENHRGGRPQFFLVLIRQLFLVSLLTANPLSFMYASPLNSNPITFASISAYFWKHFRYILLKHVAWTCALWILDKHGHTAWICIRTCNQGMQQVHQRGHTAYSEHVARKCSYCSTDMQQGHAAKTCRLDKLQGHAKLSCSIDMQHRHATLTSNMGMQQGHSIRCRKDMQQRYATCPGLISMLHGHAVNPSCIWTCSMDLDMLLVRASCPGCMDMLQAHNVYPCCMSVLFRNTKNMFRLLNSVKSKSPNILLVRWFSGLAEVGSRTSANANPLTIYIPLIR
jgi:hypothetical protein